MAEKLEIYGFNKKKPLALFNSYMTNRTQQVLIGNALHDIMVNNIKGLF
jgi:hypothetical protein